MVSFETSPPFLASFSFAEGATSSLHPVYLSSFVVLLPSQAPQFLQLMQQVVDSSSFILEVFHHLLAQNMTSP